MRNPIDSFSCVRYCQVRHYVFYTTVIIAIAIAAGCHKNQTDLYIDQAELLRAVASDVLDDYAAHHHESSVLNILTTSQLVQSSLRELVQAHPEARVIVTHPTAGNPPRCFLISGAMLIEAYPDNGIPRIRNITTQDFQSQRSNVLWQFPISHRGT